jgi:hypothetical protein
VEPERALPRVAIDAATLLNDATPRDVASVVGSCPHHACRSRVTAEYTNYIGRATRRVWARSEAATETGAPNALAAWRRLNETK